MLNSKSIDILQSQDCCGCAACVDTCPQKCISMRKMQDGFMYPVIDGSVCNNCGLCAKKCPSLSPSMNLPQATASSVYAKSIAQRDSGSSGGVFGILAEFVLNEGGKVWGAAFDEKLYLVHKCALHEKELAPLLKSKYIQSDLSGVYRQVLQDLKIGRFTLFCGTPCQCNALKNYVGSHTDKLLLVDFVCHGVPSQDLFDKTIDWYEKKYKVRLHLLHFDIRAKGLNILSHICVCMRGILNHI